jgi:hypothetical protein
VTATSLAGGLSQLKRFAPRLRALNGAAADVFALAGAALIVVGIGEVYRPAAFVCAGVFLLVFSFAMTRSVR